MENNIENFKQEFGIFQKRTIEELDFIQKKVKSLEDSILGLLPLPDTNKIWQEITKLQQRNQIIDYKLEKLEKPATGELTKESVKEEKKPFSLWDLFKK